MAENDYPGLLDACLRLGDTSRGGDAQLWIVVLKYLAAKDEDVSKEVSFSSWETKTTTMMIKNNTNTVIVVLEKRMIWTVILLC